MLCVVGFGRAIYCIVGVQARLLRRAVAISEAFCDDSL